MGRQAPDLILHNAHIIPMAGPPIKRGFVVVAGGRILALEGGQDWQRSKTTGTVVVDCGGKPLVPGFIDSHFHLRASAQAVLSMDFAGGDDFLTIEHIIEGIQAKAASLPKGHWIRARGYHEFHLAEKRHPTRWDLDRASSRHPIRLTHRTGHAHVLNSMALRLVGITRHTPDPPGGLIERDLETGEPTGVLYEMGKYLSRRMPPQSDGELERGIREVNRRLLSCGVTSIHEASQGNGLEELDRIRRWKRGKAFLPRARVLLGTDSFEGDKHFSPKDFPGDNHVSLGGVKVILDETTGRLHPGQEELNRKVFHVHRMGMQVAIHAIEGHAVESACEAIEYALGKYPRPDHRHRIEHCSLCTPSLSRRLAEQGIAVVTQPCFVYYNGDRYLESIPVLKGLYATGTLMKSGIVVAGSSDCPVAPPDPLIGVYAAVSRRAKSGAPVISEEAISTLDALKMYTVHGAWVGFEERVKGTLTPGKLADMVLLSTDPTRVPPEELRDIHVEMTLIDGEIAWREETFDIDRGGGTGP
ncbi:MAG: amidohydrolase [Deltaproteobacteria bacterium]|nr:amidohydrolase [Deltaproteobacteria bacterium]MBW2136308.1 amidohydrolase [Deltaproteobacteria bacterium]